MLLSYEKPIRVEIMNGESKDVRKVPGTQTAMVDDGEAQQYLTNQSFNEVSSFREWDCLPSSSSGKKMLGGDTPPPSMGHSLSHGSKASHIWALDAEQGRSRRRAAPSDSVLTTNPPQLPNCKSP